MKRWLYLSAGLVVAYLSLVAVGFVEWPGRAGDSRLFVVHLCDGQRRELRIDPQMREPALSASIMAFLDDVVDDVGERDAVCPRFSPFPEGRVVSARWEYRFEVTGGLYGMRTTGGGGFELLKEERQGDWSLLGVFVDRRELYSRVAAEFIRVIDVIDEEVWWLGDEPFDLLGKEP